MPFNPNSIVKDNEDIYRVVHPWNKFWKKKHTKLSTAAFKDPNGLSVDRSYNRDADLVKIDFQNRDFKGSLISGNAKDCRTAGTYIKTAPSPTNQYHSLLLDSPKVLEISAEKREKLVKIFSVVFEDVSI